MTTPTELSALAKDEIDLRRLTAALQRNWQLIVKVAGGTLLASTLYAFSQPRVWKGEFQIVLADEVDGGSKSLIGSNPLLSSISSLSGKGNINNIATEVKILESPSVLKPVYDFVRESKRKSGKNVDGMRLSNWVKSVEVGISKGTSVLNIAYTDTDKMIVLPVINRISTEYQDYSGRDRRKDLANVATYLQRVIGALTPKAEASMQAAQSYALNHGLGITDGMSAAASTGATSSAGSIEAARQQAQAKVLLLEEQLALAKASGDNAVFQAPQLAANAELYSRYQAVEARLSDLRSRLRDNDELVRNLARQRQSLIRTLNQQTVGLLKGQLASAQAALAASSRPKEVVLKHRELVRQALRDEKTLVELENQLQLAQLEQAKQSEPWELISNPTLLDAPIAPNKRRIMALGLLAGLVAGSGVALVVDRLSGLVFSEEELQQLLPGPLLAHLNPASMQGKLSLLARGALAGSHRVAVIAVGLPTSNPMVKRVLSQLQEQLPHTELLCSSDLVQAASCDHQLLVTRLGAPNRHELANLHQQLNLQNRPITGWLLLDEASAT